MAVPYPIKCKGDYNRSPKPSKHLLLDHGLTFSERRDRVKGLGFSVEGLIGSKKNRYVNPSRSTVVWFVFAWSYSSIPALR